MSTANQNPFDEFDMDIEIPSYHSNGESARPQSPAPPYELFRTSPSDPPLALRVPSGPPATAPEPPPSMLPLTRTAILPPPASSAGPPWLDGERPLPRGSSPALPLNGRTPGLGFDISLPTRAALGGATPPMAATTATRLPGNYSNLELAEPEGGTPLQDEDDAFAPIVINTRDPIADLIPTAGHMAASPRFRNGVYQASLPPTAHVATGAAPRGRGNPGPPSGIQPHPPLEHSTDRRAPPRQPESPLARQPSTRSASTSAEPDTPEYPKLLLGLDYGTTYTGDLINSR